ncbi:hypothetical protein [Brevibacillus sp. HD3.3A]|uniref:hypothetical protein n=1 Tax=Brevibacillus sp. HD3.3A TaxID=2738979 RepID=UPI00156AA8AE|nr:hypothetical protein [Brevibacillus sp. HD3.3A]UED72119.1 hypothetical protein HP435_28860 [Brevibacillus sp. HD3.3A]
MKSTFRAEVKKFNTDGKKRVIQLEVVGKMSSQAILNTDALTGSVVEVVLDDNQLTIDDVEEEENDQIEIDDLDHEDREGIEYTTDVSGVVEINDADRVVQEFEAARDAEDSEHAKEEKLPFTDTDEESF